jgi:kumamolisin
VKTRTSRISSIVVALALAFSAGAGGVSSSALQRSAPARVRLGGHVPRQAVREAKWMGSMAPDFQVPMTITLPLRNTSELRDLLTRLYDPTDPMYGKFLTSKEFTDRFGPTQGDYDDLAAYARSLGLTVTGTHPNRTLLNVSAPVRTVEGAFNLHMHRYRAPDGREFRAPDADPEVPDYVATRISGVIGLDNAAVWHTNHRFLAAQQQSAVPLQIGTGPGGALTPGDITTAYNLGGVAAKGAGQALALFELDGYTASDITAYESYYGLPAVPLKNVLVDGFSGRAGSGAGEVTLDIELMVALAPGASQILVYEGPNTNAGVIDTYNRIATDNSARQISTSWGLSETQSSSSFLLSESNIFLQMAAQGQSIYAASGDSGAFDNGSSLSVDDPASQPYMVGVGGTQLYVGSGEVYSKETTWNNGSISSGAGGGGVSVVWGIPSYQQGLTSATSSAMRNVPDVALNANQYSGYSIYFKGSWYIYGGTSCAAPLWAAFTARVNQLRAAAGGGSLGFANAAIYQIAAGGAYGVDFHDIADGSTNLYYAARTGYDNATGWGSFNGANLLNDLAQYGMATTLPATPTNLAAKAGDTTIALSWSASSGAASYNLYRSTTASGEGTTPYRTGIVSTGFTDTGLTNGTPYFYKVAASNNAGLSGLSNEASATPVAAPLQITVGPTANPGKNNATIGWTTNLASNSVVYYGTNPANLNRTAAVGSLVTAHSVGISGLLRRTTYYYKVASTAGSTTVTSGVFSFSTQ